VRARFIGGPKDEQVIEGIPEPPPGHWSDADGDYELFAIFEPDVAVYKLTHGDGPAPEPDRYLGWRWRSPRRRPFERRPTPTVARAAVRSPRR
jgi:hypothetical protein